MLMPFIFGAAKLADAKDHDFAQNRVKRALQQQLHAEFGIGNHRTLGMAHHAGDIERTCPLQSVEDFLWLGRRIGIGQTCHQG